MACESWKRSKEMMMEKTQSINQSRRIKFYRNYRKYRKYRSTKYRKYRQFQPPLVFMKQKSKSSCYGLGMDLVSKLVPATET